MFSKFSYKKVFEIQDTKKNFDKVTRIIANSDGSKDKKIEIDVHDIYFDFLKSKGTDKFELTLSTEKDDISLYDYAMHGLVFKKKEESTMASFGGLLMELNEKIDININQNLFCYMNAL
jgi:hypothetical protein